MVCNFLLTRNRSSINDRFSFLDSGCSCLLAFAMLIDRRLLLGHHSLTDQSVLFSKFSWNSEFINLSSLSTYSTSPIYYPRGRLYITRNRYSINERFQFLALAAAANLPLRSIKYLVWHWSFFAWLILVSSQFFWNSFFAYEMARISHKISQSQKIWHFMPQF